ncbi:beta-1,4-N-acetylgalactosaminyltransferase 3 [Salminus brasiliensis]|uniref:beta-1,4-N-acetylgalactosaminyltransferase 3 n=1 Tax=Salminus brasiliensis TaxID=930266 RepID=UPI003B82DCE4
MLLLPFFPLRKIRRNGGYLLFGAVLVVAALATYLEFVARRSWRSKDDLQQEQTTYRASAIRRELHRDQAPEVHEEENDWASRYTPQPWKPEYKGQANLHVFEDWCGSSVTQLRKNLHYPLYPHSRSTVRKLAVAPSWTNYGLRIFGYIHPYTDGEFVFAVASDDNCEFWLSRDHCPHNLKLRAYVGKTGKEWTAPGEYGKYASQISQPVQLQQQMRYYFELIHKQDNHGTDHVEVAWRLNQAGTKFTVIGSQSLSLYTNESSLKMDYVSHIPQTPASNKDPSRDAAPSPPHGADMLREDPRDIFYQVPLLDKSRLWGVLPECTYEPSYTLKGYMLQRYQGLQFVRLLYVYPNDYTRLTHMENENTCFYQEKPQYLERFGFSSYMNLDQPDGDTIDPSYRDEDRMGWRQKLDAEDYRRLERDEEEEEEEEEEDEKRAGLPGHGKSDHTLQRQRKLFSTSLTNGSRKRRPRDTREMTRALGPQQENSQHLRSRAAENQPQEPAGLQIHNKVSKKPGQQSSIILRTGQVKRSDGHDQSLNRKRIEDLQPQGPSLSNGSLIETQPAAGKAQDFKAVLVEAEDRPAEGAILEDFASNKIRAGNSERSRDRLNKDKRAERSVLSGQASRLNSSTVVLAGNASKAAKVERVQTKENIPKELTSRPRRKTSAASLDGPKERSESQEKDRTTDASHRKDTVPHKLKDDSTSRSKLDGLEHEEHHYVILQDAKQVNAKEMANRSHSPNSSLGQKQMVGIVAPPTKETNNAWRRAGRMEGEKNEAAPEGEKRLSKDKGEDEGLDDWMPYGDFGLGDDIFIRIGFDPEVNWAQTFQVKQMDFQTLRSDSIDLACNVSGNLLIDQSEAVAVVQALMEKLNEKFPSQFSLQQIVNVEKRPDVTRGSRYLLELDLLDRSGSRVRLAQYIYVLQNHDEGRGWGVRKQRKNPKLLLCNPHNFQWNPTATVHFIIPVKNQARWVQQFIVDMEELYRATGDKNFNIIITDYSSTDMDIKQALENSQLPRYQYLRLEGNFQRSAGLQAGIDLITDKHSILFLCDLHIHFPLGFIDSVRRHCVEGRMAFAPIVMRLNCGATPQEPDGYWEVNGFGLLGIYKSDLDSIGGMNTKDFTDRWGGEDWELLDRILEAGLEVERLYVRNFFHYHHSRRGMWNRRVVRNT